MKPFTMQESGITSGDYVMFFSLGFLSCLGGVWYSVYGCTSEALVDLKGYFFGRSMTIVPVAISLVASFISGATLLGTPPEIYNYGMQYLLIVVGVVVSCLIVSTVYLPVYFTLKIASSYEYLELRFNRHVRAIAALLFIFDEILFLPIVVYIPALAFHDMAGYNVISVGTVMLFIGGLYTALGGVPAVIWTGVAQTSLMILSILLVALVGTIVVGGVEAVYEIALVTGRTDLSNWSISFYERQTGWGVLIGGMIYWTCFNSVNQTMVQRYLALPTPGKAMISIAIFGAVTVVTITFCVYCGLAAYATWVRTGCHPNARPIVDDRLLPAFVIYITTTCKIPGLSGIFLAGLFGAGLSSLSVILNSCSLVIVEDLVHRWMKIRMNTFTEGLLARTVTLILCFIMVFLTMIVKELGGMLSLVTTFSAIASSITCGIFTLGMLCSWVGPRGAIAGAGAGAFTSLVIASGSLIATAMGLRQLPLGINTQCTNITSFQSINESFDHSSVFPLFRVSYHWVAPAGLFTTLIVGAMVGRTYDVQDAIIMDAELFSPVVWRFLPATAHAHAGDVRNARKLEKAVRHRSPNISSTAVDKGDEGTHSSTVKPENET